MHDETVKDHVTTLSLAGALAAFSDGASTRGVATAEAIAAIAGAWIGGRLGRSVPLLFARQEHTRITYVYGAEGPLAPGPHPVGVCDALITDVPGVALQVRTADCLPVALAGGGVAAMVHAGWRGLAADILGATLRRFDTDFGIPAGEVSAAIGVGIGPCHYQVGPEVVEALDRVNAAAARWRVGEAVDLAAFARGRLEALGIPAARVTVVPGCTACLPRYHSHRRDGAGSGRQWSLVVNPGGAQSQ